MPPHEPAFDELALLVYISRTMGPSEGAMLTHASIGNHGVVSPDWVGLTAPIPS